MVGTIRLFSYGHCQTDGVALIIHTISKHIFSGIGFLKYASFHIVD